MSGRGMGGHQTPIRGETNTWITPKWLVEALGPFDLDPCAATPQPWPLAAREFTITDDGLAQDWAGRVWMNPPYGPEAGVWLRRLADHGDGIALVFARTETRDFVSEVWHRADGLLFIAGRLQFCRPSGAVAKGSNSGAPSVLVAYGASNVEALRTSGLRGAMVEGWRVQ